MYFGVLAAELKRRRVIRAVVVWSVVAFAVLQIYEAVMHGLHLPEWTLSFVVVMLGLGFPVTVALAWAFDLTAHGVERTGAPEDADLRDPRLALVLLGCGLLAAAPGIAWHFVRSTRAEPTTELPVALVGPSIAVLSFADMSPGHDQEYFADGIAEEILNALAHVDGLRVPGRTSSFHFKGQNVTLAEIGRVLRVATVLQGSIRKDGSRVRITAQLVRIEDETHLWSETFERELTGVFAVQDDIARAVVKALEVRLPATATPAPLRPTPQSPEAYAQYLLGRHLFFTGWSLQTLPRALEYFERSVTLDPAYAPAWAFVSITITQMAALRETVAPEDRQRAISAAERAIALAPDESAGYVARAYLRNFLLWDWAGAQADCERALTRKTSHVNPQNQYSLLLGALGRTRDAIAFARKATDLDPLNTPYWSNLGAYYVAAGELEAAHTALMRSVEISPGNSRGTYRLGLVYLLQGEPLKALASFEQLSEEPTRLVGTAIANHEAHRPAESRRAFDQLLSGRESNAYRIAEVHAWFGERDEAFAWLDRAYDRHSYALNQIKLDPLLQRIRGDARYAALLRRMNLPVD